MIAELSLYQARHSVLSRIRKKKFLYGRKRLPVGSLSGCCNREKQMYEPNIVNEKHRSQLSFKKSITYIRGVIMVKSELANSKKKTYAIRKYKKIEP